MLVSSLSVFVRAFITQVYLIGLFQMAMWCEYLNSISLHSSTYKLRTAVIHSGHVWPLGLKLWLSHYIQADNGFTLNDAAANTSAKACGLEGGYSTSADKW